MNQLFVSYSRKDTEFARRLTEKLTAQNMEVWVDWEDIPPSVDWMKEIEKGIEEADIFIFVVSPDSIRSRVCGEEVAHAIKNGKRIAPVIAREVDMQEAPATLTHLNWIFFCRPQDDFNVSDKVREYCIKHGQDEEKKIVLAWKHIEKSFVRPALDNAYQHSIR